MCFCAFCQRCLVDKIQRDYTAARNQLDYEYLVHI